MSGQKNKGFLRREIDKGFDVLYKYFFIAVNFITSKTGDIIYELKDMRARFKTPAQNHLELGEEFLRNNNLFDAKIRYNIVLKIDKHNLEALFALGYISFLEKKKVRAESYLNTALKFATTSEETSKINELLKEVENLK